MNEAPYSLNTHYTLRGWPFQLTIRSEDYESFSKSVEEAITQLEKAGAVPADMIWAGKPKTTSDSRPDFFQVPTTGMPPTPNLVTPRGPGRPPKRADTYMEKGVEHCNHLIGGALCTTIGEWKEFPDKYRPGQTKLLWSCAQFFDHDDYKAKEALRLANGG